LYIVQLRLSTRPGNLQRKTSRQCPESGSEQTPRRCRVDG